MSAKDLERELREAAKKGRVGWNVFWSTQEEKENEGKAVTRIIESKGVWYCFR